MSLHFLQMATQWLGSKQDKLANAAFTLCYAVRYAGIRDLTLSFANGLLAMLHTDCMPQQRLRSLMLLKSCRATYPHLNQKLVLDLLEPVMSWEEQKVRDQARSVVASMLEASTMDDEAFVLANRRIISMESADHRGNMDKAAAEQQKLIGWLREQVGS